MITKKISLVVPLSSFDTEKKTAILSLRKGLDDMSETLESQHGYSGYELILACSFDFKEDIEELQDTWGNVVILNCKKK